MSDETGAMRYEAVYQALAMHMHMPCAVHMHGVHVHVHILEIDGSFIAWCQQLAIG